MPSGRVHVNTTILLATGLAVVIPLAGWPVSTGLIVAAGCLAGAIISPDLDCNEGNISVHLLGCAGQPWRWYWWLYAKMFPHRGISHCPLIGTATRLVYFPWPWLCLLYYNINTGAVLLLLTGLALADVLHYLLDAADKLLGGVL